MGSFAVKVLTTLALTSIFCLTTRSLSAEPLLEKTNLFEAEKDGYKLYRIPGIVVTAKGTLLAYCEARKNDSGDWGPIDIMLRRSSDGGKTWEPRRKLVEPGDQVPKNPVALKQKLGKPGDVTVNNPVAIVDHKTGAVHFLYCIEYGHCFYLRSDDDGKTFSKPVEITAAFEKFKPDYVANPHNPDNRQRKNLTIKLSYDECKTWAVAKSLEPGVSAYSDLAVGPDGTVYCFYERGSLAENHFKTRYLCVARFNLDWLTDGKDSWQPRGE